MKFREYLFSVADLQGYVPTPRLRWTISQNQRQTAREEAIAAKILQEANPRENITGHFSWGPEQQLVLQQLWIHPATYATVWRDVPVQDAKSLYSTEDTEHGPLPVPNAIRQPGQVQGDFRQRIREALGEDSDE